MQSLPLNRYQVSKNSFIPVINHISSRFESSQATVNKDQILHIPVESKTADANILSSTTAPSTGTDGLPEIPIIDDALPDIPIVEEIIPLVCISQSDLSYHVRHKINHYLIPEQIRRTGARGDEHGKLVYACGLDSACFGIRARHIQSAVVGLNCYLYVPADQIS